MARAEVAKQRDDAQSVMNPAFFDEWQDAVFPGDKVGVTQGAGGNIDGSFLAGHITKEVPSL